MKIIYELLNKEKCDVCGLYYRKSKMLYDENLQICQSCAQHMNDISEEDNE